MKKIRVLHVVNNLACGGIETWLRNLVLQQDRRFQNDFVVLRKTNRKSYDDEIKNSGSRVLGPLMPPVRSKLLARFLLKKEFAKILRTNRYDVVHVHAYNLAGGLLSVASDSGVPVRIVHSHNQIQPSKGLTAAFRRLYATRDRRLVLKYATDIAACSQGAGRSFIDDSVWNNDPRCSVIYCGIDLDEFRLAASQLSSSVKLRQRYGIPEDAVVIGHVGSMKRQKNQKFFLDICRELSRRSEKYYFFLAGEGTLYDEVREYACTLGIQDRVVMPGLCKTPEIMCGLFDVFLFPSLFEGLGIVILEAAASGLFTICSDMIPKDLTESSLKDRIHCVSLTEPELVWANCVEESVGKKISPAVGMEMLEKSCFTISSSLDQLYGLYSRRLGLG